MKPWTTAMACGVLALAAHAQTSSQVLRDPTLAPMGAVSGGAGEGVLPGDGLPLSQTGTNVVLRNGKPLLVVGSRLVAPGQTVESYRLERITETEIWLRDASGLTKVPRFAGVQRQPAMSQCPTPSPKAAAVPQKSVKKPSSRQRTLVRPPGPKAGTGAPSSTREKDPHDC